MRRAALGLAWAMAAAAHEPITTKLTWTKEISRIVYKRCVHCHREGGSAPMSLVNYEEARPWAKAIRDEVLERRMPPWGAVKGFGEFQNDASLSEREIEMLASWVEGGAPEGEAIYLPPVPAKVEPPPTPATRKVELPAKLPRETRVVGIEPEAPGQVVAHRPDGSFVPLIWLLHQRTEQPKAFFYEQAVVLPRGTVVGGRGRLLISAGKPAK